jgi:hypothetical protein
MNREEASEVSSGSTNMNQPLPYVPTIGIIHMIVRIELYRLGIMEYCTRIIIDCKGIIPNAFFVLWKEKQRATRRSFRWCKQVPFTTREKHQKTHSHTHAHTCIHTHTCTYDLNSSAFIVLLLLVPAGRSTLSEVIFSVSIKHNDHSSTRRAHNEKI